MKPIIPFCIALTLGLSGCGTLSTQERQKAFMSENDAFVGKSHDDLIKDKGVPTGTATLSDGSKVVEYYNAQVEVSGGGYYAFPSTTYLTHANGTRTWIYMDHMQTIPVRSWYKICKIDFIVSSTDIVASWKFDGKGCY